MGRNKPKTAGIIEMIVEFRDLVNEPRRRESLAKNQSNWRKLHSAMDVIGDTSMAVRAYSSQEDTNDKGKLYLETYGVLQALQVRQDAIFDLCDVLGSKRNKGDFPGLEDLRSARKSIAGHPTKRQREGEGPREGPHHLVQTSLHRNSLQLMSFSHGGPKFTHINLDALIRKQESELGQILGGLITDLKDAEAKHKAQFLGSKVEAVFPRTLATASKKYMNTFVEATWLAWVRGDWMK